MNNYDKQETDRVSGLRKEANKRPHLRASKSTTRYRSSIRVSLPGSLGYSTASSLGDAVRGEIVRKEEFAAQHGPVKVLWKDGKPVS